MKIAFHKHVLVQGLVSLFLISLLVTGCATIRGFSAGSEREQGEKEKLQETVKELELKEEKFLKESQNLKLEVERLKESESTLHTEMQKLRDEKAELEQRLVSSRKHQKRLETQLAEGDKRLAQLIEERKEGFAELDKVKRELSSGLEKYSGVSFGERGDAVAIILENIVTLKSGKVSIREGALPVLGELAKILKQFPANRLKITGHTDDIPIKLSYPGNWELSAARALAILHYLEDAGIDPARMSAVGHGEYTPRATNTTAEGRARNRRVEILVLETAKE